MLKKDIEQILFFRVIDSHWKCTHSELFSGTLADFLALFNLEYLPDSLEFASFHIKDDFRIYIYKGASCVMIKLINKPSNFLQNEQNP